MARPSGRKVFPRASVGYAGPASPTRPSKASGLSEEPQPPPILFSESPSGDTRPSSKSRWEKSIVREDYRILLKPLRAARLEAGMTQQQLGDALGQTQTFISKAERGERRLDLMETRLFCLAISLPFEAFVARLEKLLKSNERGER